MSLLSFRLFLLAIFSNCAKLAQNLFFFFVATEALFFSLPLQIESQLRACVCVCGARESRQVVSQSESRLSHSLGIFFLLSAHSPNQLT